MMEKKGIKIVISFLMVQIVIFSVLSGTVIGNENGDELDQEQTSSAGWVGSLSVPGFAQSFRPTMKYLTRIELHMAKTGTPNVDFVVSIRKNINDADLVSVSKTGDQIGGGARHWVEFDFQDVAVIPDHVYFIVEICDYINVS